jgi:hypothetical protein
VAAVLAKDTVQIHMCLTKDRHASKEAAELAGSKREAKSGKVLRSYLCPYCGGYHLTKKPLEDFPRAA